MEAAQEINTSMSQEELDLLDIIATIIVETIMSVRLNASAENMRSVQT